MLIFEIMKTGKSLSEPGRRILLLICLLLALPGPARCATARISSKTHRIVRSDGKRMGVLVLSPRDEADTLRTGILWIHGGGYITGMKSMAKWVGRPKPLVEKYGAVVVSPGYRLSIQHRYPAAIEDCYDALRWMVSHAAELGIRTDQIFVGGESAGGGLTAALCILSRDRGEFSIAYQMPLYPMLDDRDTESSRDNHNKVWNTKLNHFGWEQYLGELYGSDDVPPYAAAARETDYRGLPPAYTFVSTGEPFYCETLAYVAHLREAGIPADCDVFEGLYHAFDIYQPGIPESRLATTSFEQHFLFAKSHYFAPQPETAR